MREGDRYRQIKPLLIATLEMRRKSRTASDRPTLLVPCIYLTHQREDLYPEPKKFKPERWELI